MKRKKIKNQDIKKNCQYTKRRVVFSKYKIKINVNVLTKLTEFG